MNNTKQKKTSFNHYVILIIVFTFFNFCFLWKLIEIIFWNDFRLSPAVFILLLVQLSIYGHFGSGPLWNFMYDDIRGKCERNWWAVLLYIQNYHNYNDVVSIMPFIICQILLNFSYIFSVCYIHGTCQSICKCFCCHLLS